MSLIRYPFRTKSSEVILVPSGFSKVFRPRGPGGILGAAEAVLVFEADPSEVNYWPGLRIFLPAEMSPMLERTLPTWRRDSLFAAREELDA